MAIFIFTDVNLFMDNKISFTSKINFVSTPDFRKLWQKNMTAERIVDEPWTFADTKCSKDYLGTIAINTCSSLNIANAKEAIMLHLSTCKENFENLSGFTKSFKTLPKDYKFKSALLIGSKSPDTPGLDPIKYPPQNNNSIYDLKSRYLFEKLEKIFKRFDLSVFEGHASPNTGTHYIYDVKNDIYYINTKLDVFDPKSRIRNWDDLRKAFNRIEISPRDEVDFIL